MRTLPQVVAELKMMMQRNTPTREQQFRLLHDVLQVIDHMAFPDQQAFKEKRQQYRTEE